MVESISTLNLTPSDWVNMCQAVLHGGKYLIWKVTNQELCAETTCRNAAPGFHQQNLDMLLGKGLYTEEQQQIMYDPGVYLQIATTVVRAWETLQGHGDLQGQLSKVIQGSNEPCAEFVDHLLQATGRVFGDSEQAMPLIKQLAYEQANKWCREAIRPWKNKDLNTYLKICRDINESAIQGQVLAAAVTQGEAQAMGAKPKSCFSCGLVST